MSERKKGLVPRLRFPEFREAGEWEEITLDDVCERIMDGTHFSPKSKSGPYLYLTSKNVRQGFLVLNDVSHISADEHKSIFTRCPVKKNDLLLTKDGASTGNCALNPLDYEFSLLSSVAVIRGNNENILQEFLAHDFQSRHVQDQIFDAIAGQAITRITLEKIKRFKVWSISLKEQQKIAACLTTLDALIAAQADKLDALKTHKQGLMQRLFPREGETVPRLRFPEFREAGEWEEITLGKIAKFISGGTPSKDVADYWKGSIPWISASSMHDIKIEKSDFSITDAAVKAGTRIAKKGTLLLLVRGSMLHKRIPMGISAIDVAFNQDVKALELKGNITAEYLIYFLSARESELLGQVTSTGIGAGKLDTHNLREFPVVIPVAKEQHKITDCLSSLDSLIAAQADKLDALKTHKQGLMQQLFPSPDADIG